MKLKETRYCILIAEAVIQLSPTSTAHLERIRIKRTGHVEIRLSWRKNGKFMPRPCDLPEVQFLALIAEGIRKGVLFNAESIAA